MHPGWRLSENVGHAALWRRRRLRLYPVSTRRQQSGSTDIVLRNERAAKMTEQPLLTSLASGIPGEMVHEDLIRSSEQQ